ncbi:MAG: hypothetical protein HY315_10285 [Acidobacteria bacterium]|nr:hypothetical protein [Acidobacteriota bacterium]
MELMVWLGTALFGFFVLAGGCFGYAKVRSVMSLAAGISCGALLLYAAYALREGQAAGIIIAWVVSVLLAVIFAIRWTRTRKFMPAGVLLLLSLAELALLWLRG